MADRKDVQVREEKQFSEEVVNINRVARVVKGGRRFRFQALVVVGDGKGRVGVGLNKGKDVQAAVAKAVDSAKKNIVTIPIENTSIPHETQAKVGGANILLIPARDGTGIIAGGVVRTIVEAAGIKNVLSKSLGSSNKINSAYATIKALTELEPRSAWVTTQSKKSDKKSKATKQKVEAK